MLNGLVLTKLSEGRFLAPHVSGHPTPNVFGGQLLGQMTLALHQTFAPQPLTSVHAVFARPARPDAELLIDLDIVRSGRNASVASLTIHQGAEPCVNALAVAMKPQTGVAAAHSLTMPNVVGPDRALPIDVPIHDVEVRSPDDVDLSDLSGGHPPELNLWIRTIGADSQVGLAKAMIAYAGEMSFVGTALRPHEGLSEAILMTEIMPAVVSHSLAFHTEDIEPNGWLLFTFSAPSLQAGRVYGRADVFAQDGQLVASLNQENLLRHV